jgi:hypothetical protein
MGSCSRSKPTQSVSTSFDLVLVQGVLMQGVLVQGVLVQGESCSYTASPHALLRSYFTKPCRRMAGTVSIDSEMRFRSCTHGTNAELASALLQSSEELRTVYTIKTDRHDSRTERMTKVARGSAGDSSAVISTQQPMTTGPTYNLELGLSEAWLEVWDCRAVCK